MADDRETQLLRLMTADAAEFAKRELGKAAMIDGEDKIAIAKRNWEIKKLNRIRQERIVAGLKVKKLRRTVGTMAAGEAADGFRATDGKCVVCGKTINRDRSRTCSPRCGRARRAAIKAINHAEVPRERQNRSAGVCGISRKRSPAPQGVLE